ncbi:MAG: T9SS type A sorting domain-containing protein [Agriterribacter sp.]
MKKHQLLLWLVVMPFFLSAQQTYTWNVASGVWTTSSNWLPQRNTPANNDILVFNMNADVSGLPASESIGKISIRNNAVVRFTATMASTITIGDATVAGPHLDIEAGSSMNVAGSNAIVFNIAAAFTGQVNGAIDFSGAAHRLTAQTASALIFTNGATFTANNGFAGNAFGTTNSNSVIFQSGATYILKDGGNPFGAAAPNTVTIFNAGSIYRHQVNGTGPSLAGRTYGNLYIESNVNFAGIGSARDCIIQNDLSVLSGFFSFKPNTLGTHTGNFKIYGNISASGSSYIDIGSPNMPGAVQLLGGNQLLGSGGGTGNITFQHLTVNNITTTLQRNIKVTGVLTLTGGKITSTSTALLSLSATASIQSCTHDYFNLPYTNIGCDNAYIEGPIQKLGLVNADFAFPTGVNGKLRPARLKNATGDFTVEFVRGDPYLLSSTMGAGIHHISRLEYWNITGTGTANVEVTYFDPNSGGVTDMNALRVVRYTGTEWSNQGVDSYLGSPGANGSITSTSISTFGTFTLAGSSDYPNNPLPVTKIALSVLPQTETVLLNWKIENKNLYKQCWIERSENGIDFHDMGVEVNLDTIDNQPDKWIDPAPVSGRNYYRLRLTGWNGQVYYSAITNILMPDHQKVILYPNPSHEKIFIKIPTTSSISKIAIVHIGGSVIKWLTPVNQTAVSVDIHFLTPGVYFIKILQAGSFTLVPFVKY